MSFRRLWAVLGFLCCYSITWTQPLPDDTWLTIRVTQADGTAYAPATGEQPRINLYRIKGTSREPAGQEMAGVIATYIGLTPGAYEMRLSFANLSWYDKARTMDIVPGANLLEWRLPAQVTVETNLVLAGKPLTGITSMRAFIAQIDYWTPRMLNVTITNEQCTLPPLYSGAYRLVYLCDRYLGATDFTVSTPPPAPVSVAMQRLNGLLTFEVTAAGTPAPDATITLSGQLAPGIVAPITIKTDAKGAAGIRLPDGNWHWQVAGNEIYAPREGDATLSPTHCSVTVPVKLAMNLPPVP